MSAISGVGGSQISQIFQQFQQSPGGFSALQQQMPAELQSKMESAAQSAGIDPSQFSAIRQDVESVIANLEPGADPREALGAVFEENGVDPAELKSQMESMMGNLGFSPQGLQGGFDFGASSAQTDLFSELLSSLESSDSESSSDNDLSTLVEYMKNLPSGGLVNQFA